MKYTVVAALMGSVAAYPSMKGPNPHTNGLFKEIVERGFGKFVERQGPPPEPVILLGDLQAAGTGGTALNDQIVNCFNDGQGASCFTTAAAGAVVYTPPSGGPDVDACKADTCCIWSYIKDELVPLFLETDKTCNDVARATIRFGFHDAAAWNQNATTGGADGSLLLSADEVGRAENAGLDKAKTALLPIFDKYKSYGISAADLVQFAHNVAVVTCPLGPRSLTLIGRPDWDGSEPAPTGLLPDANSDATTLFQLFADKTIQSTDLAALVGAHSTAKQHFFDVAKAGQPLDKTPGVWDVSYYSEVLQGPPPCGVFRLPSDTNIGGDVGAVNGFRAMATGFPSDTGAGQVLWNGLYAKGFTRMSLLGVKNIQGMTDCTKVLPLDVATFDKPADATVSC